MEAKAIILLEWSFHFSLQHRGISHFSWVYFYLRVLKGCSAGENRTFLKEWFLFCILSPAFYEKAFSKRSFKYFKSPGSSTSISFKIWKAFPPNLPPGSPPRVTGWTAQRLGCTCVWSCARWTAVLGSWTKDNFQHIHESLLGALCQGLGRPFFSKKQIHFISRVSMRQGQVSFFLPLPVLFLCLRLRSS